MNENIITKNKTAISLGLVLFLLGFVITSVVWAMSVKAETDSNSESIKEVEADVDEIWNMEFTLRQDVSVVTTKLDHQSDDIKEIKESLKSIEKEIKEINQKLR